MKFNREKLKPDVIDNTENNMADVLNINLSKIKFLDVSTGYFGVSGYGMVRNKLVSACKEESFAFRLMVGKNVIHLENPDATDLKAALSQKELTDTNISNTTSLINLLKQNNVHVRVSSAKFNHAKCYILGEEGAIVGSSNLTSAGLSRNDELNTGVYVTGTWNKILAWYDRMWNAAKDAKADMIRILEESKFGAPAKPYEIYLKILFEKYRRQLDAISYDDAKPLSQELAKFQRDAVNSILQTIVEHGGAILADSTGLGKTHIGLEVIHRKISEGKKVLLIAPTQVRDTVWETKLNDAQINVKKIGMEQLGRKDFNVYKCKKYDFIIIDESQNFRSKATGRRENLMKIISLGNKRKQILLMSATPINNSLMDLYYQISIITGGRDDQFANIGIPDLFRYLDKASKHKLNDGLEKIQTLLNDIMIRRTRTFIKDVYPDERLGGQNITFPKRDYKEIRYGMTDIFGNIYQDLLDTISSLHMTPYGIEQYNTTLTDEEKRRHTVLAKLQVILLLKRFESSINAVIISIDRKIKLFEYFGKMLEKNRIVSPKQLNKIMLKWNAQNMEGDEDQDEFFMEEIKKLPVQSTTAYDIKTMKQHIKSDLNHLYRYKKSLSQMPKFDKKADAVADMILKDRALEQAGKKVLVFTEYTATAKYIKDFLEDKFDDKRVDMITGDTKEKARRKILQQFSPKANLGDDEEMSSDEIDILVSTEVLSEGQNLQDCNYIVNYDLPWNPMRIVQRIGRVDRLTSTHDTIHSRECFPDDKLDEILKLVGKLMDKIQDINDAIGLDAALLGREALPKNFSGVTIDRIRAFSSGDTGSILDEMERESDLMPTLSPINEINRHIRQMGIAQMREFSMGRRSGKSGEGPKAILAYVQEKPVRRFYSVIYDCSTQEAKVVDDVEAIALIRCTKDDETYLPMDHTTHAESFRQLLHMDSVAQKAISRQNSVDYRIANELRSKPKKNEKIIEKIRDIIDDETDHGNLSEEGADEIDKMLDYPGLLHWNDDLESYIEQYQNNNNIKSLINQLKKIGHNIGVKTDDPKIHTSGSKVLIGAMFVS